MTPIVGLLQLDLWRIRNWFRSYFGTKLFVLAGFTAVLILVIAVEYLMALTFFRLTATQDQFGQAVAQYSINAALLLLAILAVVSSIAASHATLFRSVFLGYLLTAPIPTQRLFSARLFSSLLHSTWATVILLTPILVAYGQSFAPGPDFVLRALLVLILLAMASQAIGGAVTLLLVNHFGRVSRSLLVLMFTIAISGSLILMRFLFPPAFFRLYFAEDWPAFQRQLGQLPLLSTSLPTNWLAESLTAGWSGLTILAIMATTGLVVGVVWLGGRYYLRSWQKAIEGRLLAGRSLPQKTKPTTYPIFRFPGGPLLLNELLAIVRSPAETSYVAFLTGLSLVLLFMLRNVPALEYSAPQLLPSVYALSLVGLAYLTMTLTTRLVYPTIAKERRTSWFLFTIPVRRETILNLKAAVSLCLILPAPILALAAANLMQLPQGIRAAYILITFLTVATVALLQLLLGAIAPNFAESDNLEATSTSGSGLAAIALSIFYIVLSGFAFYKVAASQTSIPAALIFLTILSIIWIGWLYRLARQKLLYYDL